VLSSYFEFNIFGLCIFAKNISHHMIRKITPIIPEYWHMDGGVAFGVVPKGIWNKLYPSDENNNLRIVNRLLLVETSSRLMLINSGFGNKRHDKYYQFKYFSKKIPLSECIFKAGYRPEDITDVVFTHLHDDHCGGTTVRNPETGQSQPLIPGANYWISEKQWQWALNPNPREAASYFPDNLLPLENSGRLNLLSPLDQPFANEQIELRHFDGHTSGQMIPLLTMNNKIYVYISDFIPSSVHIPLPYIAAVDIQPLITLKEKEAFLMEAVQGEYVLVFEHDAMSEACKVVFTDKGFQAISSGLLTTFFE